MLKKHFNCFIRWVLWWFRLPKLLTLAGKPFSMLSQPLRSALHKIAFCFGFANSSCGLITLPQEVLELILADLDWKDVLRVRATCKALCGASRSRSVWRVQYQRLSDSYDTPLKAKDGTATYSELEDDTLHWARVQRDWVSPSKRPTQRLVGRCPGLQIRLLEGGRWLLTNSNFLHPGCLSAYDLDTTNGRHRILIRPQDKRENRIETFAIEEVNTSPKIEVFVALVREHPDEQFARLSFWKVTNSLDETLIARHITSFNTYVDDISHVKDLRGDYFARFAVSYTSGPRHIDVYDWRRSCSLTHHKATIILRERLCTIRILPGQRILGLDKQTVRIYDMPNCRPVPAKCPVAGLPTAPLHTLALPGLNPYVYTPIYFSLLGNAHFYVASTEAVVKLTIPHDGQPPTGEDYIRHSPGDRCAYAFSLHRAYFRRLSTRKVLSFSRDYDERCIKTWEASEEHNYGWRPLLDDFSGRIIERASDEYIFVLDHN
ncbi:hypothetical protein PC9H_006077 [Pleurotus ostreatus]|uniref:F-box domain-containing protein n=1 Tax=Pleurotus ostreatus TaxID=5322 RepID=A0A8H6ZWZ1_PLEOS|nr:uncharacterized protein PC9H_006077 [Pleurotus ostreatus]KAF7430372.1 hypothetical protein PC9H_006077 [Pleurotus ostreatus]